MTDEMSRNNSKSNSREDWGKNPEKSAVDRAYPVDWTDEPC